MVLNGTYNNGVMPVPNSAVDVEGYDKYKRGAQQVSLRVNDKTTPLDITVRVKTPCGVNSWRAGGDNRQRDDIKPAYIKGKEFDFWGSNIEARVEVGGNILVALKAGEGGIYPEEIKGYDKDRPGLQSVTLDLDGVQDTFDVYVLDVEPAVWFDYGYVRHQGDPGGIGPGVGTYHVRPQETLVLAPVRYLIGWNDDHTPAAGTSWQWSVSGGPYDTAAPVNQEVFSFTPTAAGTYTVTVTVIGRSYVSGLPLTLSASTGVVSYTETPVPSASSWQTGRPEYLRNFAPGQFTESGTGYGWSLGMAGGYMMWRVDPQASYSIVGNAFPGWNEAGVVWVMEDNNANQVPDELWYELKGGEDEDEQYKPYITRRYALTYVKVEGGEGEVNEYGQRVRAICWADCKGRSGKVNAGGWPSPWGITGNWAAYTGTLLGDNGNIANGNYAVPVGLEGHVDTYARGTFYLKNAMDARGNPVTLTNVRFIKVQCAVFHYGGAYGDMSTEIMAADGIRGYVSQLGMP
jgi:hypothetical protein